MTPDQRRAVWTLGAAQCAFWGLLYYGYAALQSSLLAALDVAPTTLAGAFSGGLLAMAALAPYVGRALDRDRGPQAMRAGAVVGAAGLVLLAAADGPLALFAAFALLGVAMAGLLYEPAFGIVTRAFAAPHDRLRALSAVTVFGGLASTLYLPGFGLAIAFAGWRGALLVAAGWVLLHALLLERYTFPFLRQAPAATPAAPGAARTRRPRGYRELALLAVAGTYAGVALTVLLVPLLLERGATPLQAASVLGAIGASQLPGRIWLLHARTAPSARFMTVVPLLLQAGGFAVLAASESTAAALAGVIGFGAGAGLQTLARPWLVQHLFGVADAGALNGGIARAQGLFRALAPVTIVAFAAWASLDLAFVLLATVLLALLPLGWWLGGTATATTTPAAQDDEDVAAAEATS